LPCDSCLAIPALQFLPCNSCLAIPALQFLPCNSSFAIFLMREQNTICQFPQAGTRCATTCVTAQDGTKCAILEGTKCATARLKKTFIRFYDLKDRTEEQEQELEAL
jgi:hypothetical protein